MAVTQPSLTSLTALQVMQDAPVIPVIVLNDVAHAVPMARALLAGGVRMLEVTLRTPQALACIEAIARDVPEAVVGAGTIRTRADAQAAANAGARFAVSPGYTSAVGQACRDAGLALLPGVATGSEIMMAQEDGFTELKFFPAMQAGGPAMLKAWSGPFFDVKFCPTGGVTLQNAPDFLALPNVICVGGSWIVPVDAFAAGDWARVTQLAQDTQRLRNMNKKEPMSKVYWVNTYRAVKDSEKVAAYAKLAGPALTAAGGRFLARGEPAMTYELGLSQRTVVIEFDSVAQASAAHDSPAYQAALEALGDGAERDIRIIEGV